MMFIFKESEPELAGFSLHLITPVVRWEFMWHENTSIVWGEWMHYRRAIEGGKAERDKSDAVVNAPLLR